MITPDTLIEEIVEKHPELVRPLRTHGIVCVRCGEAIWGSLQEVAAEKGISDIDTIVLEMNQILSKKTF